MVDFIVKNGSIYDPEHQSWKKGDLIIENGVIASEAGSSRHYIIDADQCIVTTGLIDYHVHYFNHGTDNGVNPDAASFPSAVTTAVDAGSTGVSNYQLYRKSVMAYSDVRILNMLLVGSGGQISDQYPENIKACNIDRERIKKLFKENPDNLVGLKTRMSAGIIDPRDAEESLLCTIGLAGEIGCNVAVHVTDPVISLERICEILRPGDIICHVFQGKGQENILNRDGTVHKYIQKAARRGILFDASNGCSNYDLEICRNAVKQGFLPDVISSDINTKGFYLQPLHSLPRVMSKYLDMGMKLEKVLDAVTRKPAELINRKELASLRPGSAADICVLKIIDKQVPYSDSNGHTFTGNQVIVPQCTIKGGKMMYCQADFC